MSKVLLVTGCRSGFGYGTAIAAAHAGWRVYAGLRDPATGEALRSASRGLPVFPIPLDVTQVGEREEAVARIRRDEGALHGLVNNAGQALGGFLEQVEEDELRRLFDVNVFGAWGMTKACLPLLRESGGGTVVMLSSMSGRTAVPGLAAYAGSKFALEGLSEGWRHELALFKIRVVLIEPGAYRTDIFGRNRTLCRAARDQSGPYTPWMEPLDQLCDRLVERYAGDPREVVDRIVALLEDPRPPLRVPLGPLAKPREKLLALLPFSAVELLFSQILGRLRQGPENRG